METPVHRSNCGTDTQVRPNGYAPRLGISVFLQGWSYCLTEKKGYCTGRKPKCPGGRPLALAAYFTLIRIRELRLLLQDTALSATPEEQGIPRPHPFFKGASVLGVFRPEVLHMFLTTLVCGLCPVEDNGRMERSTWQQPDWSHNGWLAKPSQLGAWAPIFLPRRRTDYAPVFLPLAAVAIRLTASLFLRLGFPSASGKARSRCHAAVNLLFGIFIPQMNGQGQS